MTDAEDPKIQNCPKNQTLDTNPGQPTAVVHWSDLNATDNSGQIPTVSCSAESGIKFEIGEAEVLCQAIDSIGNRDTCVFTLKIEGKSIILNSEFG